jgi:DNA-binding FadR family transcriptional regulator
MSTESIFHRVSTRKAFEEAVAQIVEAVRDGELVSGDRLPSERTLASQMGISRPTLREAMKLLASAGVVNVERGPGGGTFIKSDLVPMTLLQDRMSLRVDQLSDVLEARRIIEPRIAEAAAIRADQDDFDALARIISKQRQFVGDREHLMELDRRFHLSVARATRNRMLVAQMKLLFRQLEIVRDMAVRADDEYEWSIEIHEQTLRAIMSRDLELVDQVMDEHLGYLERLWERESGRGLMTGLPDFLVRPEHRSKNQGVTPAQGLSSNAAVKV